MKVPMSWLRDYVDINVNSKEFVDAMTMSGSKVEAVEVSGEDITNVVVGKIVSLEKHPDADKLQVSKVDIGSEVLQVVTGATNISVGDYIPVALVGATLPGDKKISKGKLRGVESCGMMCSIQELNLTKEDYPDAAEHGIFILPEGFELGSDIKDALNLNETVVEFEITSNRPDCLCVLGIAREAAVTFGRELNRPEINVKEKNEDVKKYASVEITAPDLCPRYAARVIKDVKIGPSPKWMRDKLKAAGVRPINNIVDITNYVMLELGQPMHAFDLENLSGRKIIVRRAKDGEIIKTLDDQDRKLDSSMLVIADAEKPVAVAGVMGGANSEVTGNTKMILFESANFNGTSVRLTAKKLGFRTEASGRFEKGLDTENIVTAIDRAAQLVEELGAGTIMKGVIDCYVKKVEPVKVKLRPDKINEFLGTDIMAAKMIEIFRDLEFKVDEINMMLEVPSFRPDIENEADLSEEVARFYGYNNIEATLLSGKASTQGKKTLKQHVEDKIHSTMNSCGLSEIYTYSFVSPKVFDRINLDKNDILRKAVVISNPLGEDFSIMRTTTIPNMLEVLARNYNRRNDKAMLYELSYVYLPKELPITELPFEKQVLTVGMYGQVDFYDMKGVVEELLDNFGITEYDFEPEKENPTFHPGRTARLVLDGKSIGVMGEIHPKVIENFEGHEKTYICVMEIEQIIKSAVKMTKYKQLPRFPAVSRDIAMLVRDEIMVKQIENIIKQKAGKILEEIKLFDVYKGKQVPEGMKSVAYSITFRAEEKTLTDEEVNVAMGKIVNALKTGIDAQLRE